MCVCVYIQALRLLALASGHFVSAKGSLRSPGVTMFNYKGDNISKYVYLSVKIEIVRKITKFINFKNLMRNDDVITE